MMPIDKLHAAFEEYRNAHGPDNLCSVLAKEVASLRKHRVTSHALKKGAQSHTLGAQASRWLDPQRAPFDRPILVMTLAYRGHNGFFTSQGAPLAPSGWAPAPPPPIATWPTWGVLNNPTTRIEEKASAA